MSIENFTGVIIFIMGLLIMMLVIPKHKVKNYIGLGLVGGFVITIILLYLMQEVFAFWIFSNVDIIYIGGIPITLSFAWVPIIMGFSYLIGIFYRNIGATAGLLLGFSLSAVLIHYVMIKINVLDYSHWTLFYTFFTSLAIHLGIAIYVYQGNSLISPRGKTEA